MSITGLEVFDTTLQKTKEWLQEVMEQLGWNDRPRAYLALRAVLHGLRDRLTAEEVSHFGAQMPLLIRGVYYEGWDSPSSRDILRERHKEDFLGYIRGQMRGAMFPDELSMTEAKDLARAVFRVLESRISQGELSDVKQMLPKEVRDLWPAPVGRM